MINSNSILTASLYAFFTFFSCSNQHLSPSHLTSISPVFSNEWFGAVDENNHIMNSRYDYTCSTQVSYDYFTSFFYHYLNPRYSSCFVLSLLATKSLFASLLILPSPLPLLFSSPFRWAHTAMPRQTGDGVRNSYGLIRSYWNNNPDKGQFTLLWCH